MTCGRSCFAPVFLGPYDWRILEKSTSSPKTKLVPSWSEEGVHASTIGHPQKRRVGSKMGLGRSTVSLIIKIKYL